MKRYLLILIGVTLAGSAWAHEYVHPVTKQKIDARWIMNNPATRHCCGPQDCEPVPGKVAYTPLGWSVKGLKGFVALRDTYPSNDGQPWACRQLYGTMKGHIRCLFLPKGGQ